VQHASYLALPVIVVSLIVPAPVRAQLPNK
jgi:hypothetical protein